MKLRGHSYIIRAKKQLAALASSVRQEIVDVLSQMGIVSVAELAAALGRPADAIYYHLRVLQRCGLVLHAGNRNQGRGQEELFRTVSPDLRLEYRAGKSGNSREITAIVSSMLRLGTRDFRRAFHRGDAKVSGPARELWALRTTGWLSPDKLVRVNKSISSLELPISMPRRKGRLYAITILLTPVDHPARGTGAKAASRKARSR